MAEGSVLGAIAITEPDAGSDVTSIKTTASRKNEGHLINGYKRFITYGSSSGIVIVVAYTDKAKGHKGISLFVVTRDTPGFVQGKKGKKMGLRGSDTTDLIFEDCFVPEESLIGMPGEGFQILMEILTKSRPEPEAKNRILDNIEELIINLNYKKFDFIRVLRCQDVFLLRSLESEFLFFNPGQKIAHILKETFYN